MARPRNLPNCRSKRGSKCPPANVCPAPKCPPPNACPPLKWPPPPCPPSLALAATGDCATPMASAAAVARHRSRCMIASSCECVSGRDIGGGRKRFEWSEVGTRRKLQYVTEIKTLVDSFSITDVRCARSSATKRSRQKIARRALLPRRVTVPDEEREEPMSVRSRKYSLAA